MSPRGFRRPARADRKILQARLDTHAREAMPPRGFATTDMVLVRPRAAT